MDPQRHERFTRDLIGWAQDSAHVVALVGVGSTAGSRRHPDRWSDHDILVVTQPGAAEQIRRSRTWLPDHERIVLAFNEPDHGLTAIYDDGHLIEAAVAEIDDLGWFRADAFHVLVDDAEVTSTLEALTGAADETARSATSTLTAYHALLKELVIVVTRVGRGERLSATQHLHGVALPHLLTLLRSCVTPRPTVGVDPYDPTRRFESAYPDIAEHLEHSRADLEDTVSVTIELLRAHIIGHLAGSDERHVEPIEELSADLAKSRANASPA